jgi:hypothetical protein
MLLCVEPISENEWLLVCMGLQATSHHGNGSYASVSIIVVMESARVNDAVLSQVICPFLIL